ncbi:hypothetical protein KGY79_13165 [Candidatus Bipolaricaulota bacterium]|nr:hypothetical protein [Candidatus Bipolaricaulota bacterium]
MDQEKLEGIMGRLEAAGYDFSDFRINPQQLTESQKPRPQAGAYKKAM